MKTSLTIFLGCAGMVYGLMAVMLAYSEVPLNLQAFIVFGVTGVGGSVGWLVGFAAEQFRGKFARSRV